MERSKNGCLSRYQLTRQNLSTYDYKYEAKTRESSLENKRQYNVFEDGSLKGVPSIDIIDEMLEYKKFYQDEASKNTGAVIGTGERKKMKD